MLEITFSNGESGVLDMKPYLDFGIFNRLKDCKSFEKVTVVFDELKQVKIGLGLCPDVNLYTGKKEFLGKYGELTSLEEDLL
ncbi:MAG: hypothetical protein ACU841_16315, partial [Gammaproteobacteria bacterium]